MRYEDGRPYTVPDSLEELTGPIGGVVELPLLLDWSEQGRYDLSDERQRNLMYERVIRESTLAAAGYGFCLAGGHAVQAHGFVDRVSKDVDLFTTMADHDPGFDPSMFVEALRAIRRFPSSAFAPHKLTADQVDALHARLLAWADEVEAASR